MRRTIVAILLLSAWTVYAAALPQDAARTSRATGVSRGKLGGTVLTDSTNDPIQNATVVLHWNQAEGHVPSQLPGDIRLKTDMLGKFSASVTPGFYDVTVLVRGYDPETHKLVESETARQSFRCSG